MDIKKTSVKDVHKVIPQDLTELYKVLEKTFGGANPFAKVHIGAGSYYWTHDSGEWHQMIAADTIEQNLVLDAITKTQEMVSAKVGVQAAELLFSIPDDGYIYYNDTPEGIKVLLTGWGFKKPVSRSGVREDIALNKENPVSVSFSIDGSRLTDYVFGIKLPRQVKKFRTDTEGLCKFRNIKVGATYTLTDADGNEHLLSVVEGTKHYDFDLTPVQEPEQIIEEPEVIEEPIEEPAETEPEVPEEQPEPNIITIQAIDEQNRPLPVSSITLQQQGRPPLTLMPDEESKVVFQEGAFETGVLLNATLNIPPRQFPDSTSTTQPTTVNIPFVLDQGEYQYVLQEKLHEDSGASILKQIFSAVALVAACALIWWGFTELQPMIFKGIYG